MRTILHSDLNNFFASVEIMHDPSLADKFIAVTGSTESRHGIVLAKNEKAKKMGVKTGEVIWQAKQKCPELLCVPPHYDWYFEASKAVRSIYERYTDQVEPFGIDECWLDMSGSLNLFGDGMHIANEIRETVKKEIGLTVSVGVSFNKIFAKLGSDLKKPDAVTQITEEGFKEQIWGLAAEELIFVGRATSAKLKKFGIKTIGDMANTSLDFMKRTLGVNGIYLWNAANGLDESRVRRMDTVVPVKSVGHGVTTCEDLLDNHEVYKVFLHLTQDIGHRLRSYEKVATRVQIFVRDNDLYYRQFQRKLPYATQSPQIIAQEAQKLFEEKYEWGRNVRAVTVRAIGLQEAAIPTQMDLFNNYKAIDKQIRIDDAIENIRSRYGKDSVYNAVLMTGTKISPNKPDKFPMPSAMYK